MYVCIYVYMYDFGAESRLVKVDDLRPLLSAVSPGLEIDYCEHESCLCMYVYVCISVCMYVCMGVSWIGNRLL
jgi:hypothetical protein